MNAPLVFELKYYGPCLPMGPGAVPVLSNSTRSQNVWRLLSGLLSWPPISQSFLAFLLGTVFFSSKASAGTCAVQKKGQDEACPQLPIRGHTAPQSFLPLCWLQSALLCKPPQWDLKEDGQEDPHKREVRENPPLLRSKLLVVSSPSSWISPSDRA